jgi:hypothetical protein
VAALCRLGNHLDFCDAPHERKFRLNRVQLSVGLYPRLNEVYAEFYGLAMFGDVGCGFAVGERCRDGAEEGAGLR